MQELHSLSADFSNKEQKSIALHAQ